MEHKSVNISNNYRTFKLSIENRDIDLKKNKAKKLRESLKKHGWIPSFPMTCYKNGSDQLVILDGQHRFAIARELGMPVKYVIVDQEFDISEINNTQDTWKLKDYLSRWQKDGKDEYFEIEEFMKIHPNVTLSMSISLLGGQNSANTDLKNMYKEGKFKITAGARGKAYLIANAFESIIEANKDAKHNNMLKALYKCFYVDSFDPQRLIEQCEKNPTMIQPYSKTEDWLDLLQEIYNHGKKSNRIPLRFQAEEAMKDRRGY
jgi:hypothetical protein